MNCKILLSFSLLILSLTVAAQDAPVTYAITGNGNGDFQWQNIRQIDAHTGKMIKDVYLSNKTSFELSDAESKTILTTQTFKFNRNGIETEAQIPNAPTLTLVAAAAYDKRHNKLFFTPMRIGELRWLDLSGNSEIPKFFAEKVQLLNGENLTDEANHITRMDIAADGNGYAISNDGNHLIRFTTGKKITITDLGNLIDAESNKDGISIHNKCTSWGGDMIADAFGKLYIISANHQIFKVDIETRIATHLGTITGLPLNYSTNGAAVDGDGNILVSSANSFDGFYKFNMKDLKAVKIEGSDNTNASDLANGNLLYQKEADAQRTFGTVTLPPVSSINSDARVFPNPVTTSEFKVLFEKQKSGNYYVTLSDLSGRTVLNKMVTVSTKMQSETVKITSTIGKGMYLVKVTDASKQIVFTERVVVQ